MELIFLLLVLFQFKHFIADYPLQTSYMLGKAKESGWIEPLAAHAGVHALFTFIITSIFLPIASLIPVYLAVADFIIHFTVDRVKASPNIGGRFNPTQPYFWWSLGADQMTHHLTHYGFIYIIINI